MSEDMKISDITTFNDAVSILETYYPVNINGFWEKPKVIAFGNAFTNEDEANDFLKEYTPKGEIGLIEFNGSYLFHLA